MAYYPQHGGGYGQPQQPRPQAIYGNAPPSYQAHVQHMQPHGQHMPSQHQQHGQHGQHRPPMQQHLKRQASQLRTQYPDTRWCAVYVDVSSKSKSSNNEYINENELLEPVPKTDTSTVDLSMEESVLNDVMSWQDRDANEEKRFEEQRKEIEKKKQEALAAKEQKENDMISEYINISGVMDRDAARKALEKYNWNLQDAAQQSVNFSSPNLMSENNNGNKLNNFNNYNLAYGNNNNNNNNNNNSNKSNLSLILPNSETMNLELQGSDTIWDLYAKLLQSRPEFSQKAFTFELANGHKLQESEFDTTLRLWNLAPRGDIRVVVD